MLSTLEVRADAPFALSIRNIIQKIGRKYCIIIMQETQFTTSLSSRETRSFGHMNLLSAVPAQKSFRAH